MRGEPVSAAPVSSRERWIVLGLTAVALGLRAWQFQRAGLSQFDEGVYAFSGLGVIDPSQPHRLFPEQQKFSPPVYFSLVALSYLLGGVSDYSAIAVNVLLGALTVPAVWWVARQWVGPSAAMIAAALLATAGNHIELSRVALTDVTFALTFLVALGAVRWALDHPGTRSAVLAGLAVGLAWNTKYHGWFALVVGAMVIGARWLVERESLGSQRARIRAWVIMSVVATVCYLPWTVFIQSQSGATSGWAAYFATMLRINWVGNLVIHGQRLWLLESPWSRTAIALAVLFGPVTPPTWRRVVLAVVTAAAGASLASVGLAVWVIARRWSSRPSTGAWMAVGVFVLWVVMAPLYQPYFRLLLPFSITTFMLAGWALQFVDTDGQPAPRWGRVSAAALSLAVAVLMPRQSSAWRPARALADAAESIDRAIPRGAPVAVIGEPPLAFYLHERGHPAFDRTVLADLDQATAPMYVVTGHYARRAPNLRDGLLARRASLDVLGRYTVDPSDLRLFDDYNPGSSTSYRQHPDSMYDLILFRYDPGRRSAATVP